MLWLTQMVSHLKMIPTKELSDSHAFSSLLLNFNDGDDSPSRLNKQTVVLSFDDRARTCLSRRVFCAEDPRSVEAEHCAFVARPSARRGR
jgi:hypothetical protein